MNPRTFFVPLAIVVCFVLAPPNVWADARIDTAEIKARAALEYAWRNKAWAQALKYANALLKDNPQDATLTRQKGYFLGELGRMDEAIVAYRLSTKLAPQDPDNWNGLCWKLILVQNIQEASFACQQSVGIDKNIANAANFGHVFLMKEDWENATFWYGETISLIASEKELNEGLFADFDLFVAKGWSVDVVNKAKQWCEQLYVENIYEKALKLYRHKEKQAALSLVKTALRFKGVERNSENNAKLLWLVGNIYADVGDFPNAIDSMRNGLKLRIDPDFRLKIMLALGALHESQGSYSEAIAVYSQAITETERVFGLYHANTQRILDRLAHVNSEIGDISQSLVLYKQSLSISEVNDGKESIYAAGALQNLAVVYLKISDYSKALELLERSLSIAKSNSNVDESILASIFNNLSYAYRGLGDFDLSLSYANKALLVLDESKLGSSSYSVTSLSNISLAYSHKGDIDQAIVFSKRALDMVKMIQGEENPSFGMGMVNLANLYRAKGDNKTAFGYSQEAFRVLNTKLGSRSVYTALSLNSLGGLYKQMGEYSSALQHYQRALTIVDDMGDEHSIAGDSLINLAALHRQMSQPNQALPLYERYVSIIEKLRSQSGLGVENKQNLFAQYVDGYKDYAQLLGEQKMEAKAFKL